MPISVVFDPPLPSDNPSTFNTKAFTLLGDLNDWSTQANALPGEVATNLTTLLAAPPAIGSTTPAAGSFTTLSASGASGAAHTTFNAPTNGGFTAYQVGGVTKAYLGSYPAVIGGGTTSDIVLASIAGGSVSLGTGLKMTTDTGAVTIPGNTGIGLANVGVSKLEVSKDNDTLLLSGATSGGSNTPGIAFRTNPNTPTSWTSAAIKAYDGGASYGAGLKFYVNSGTTAVAASTLAIDIAQTGAATIPGGITQEAVIAPTLLNSWANLGGTTAAGYWKDTFGVVHLQGTLSGGTTTAGTALFTLPSGYRPAASVTFSTPSNTSVTSVYVNSAGSVTLNIASSTNISLDGITFKV